MKKSLLLILAALVLTIGMVGTSFAEGDEGCPCGYDEDGECISADANGECPAS